MSCSCDYEGPEFITEKEVTARKAHACSECYREIQPGEQYERVTGTNGKECSAPFAPASNAETCATPSGIHWVIVGGESGSLARPMQPEWVESIRAQCEAQGVPFFFKQWGGRRDKGGCLISGGEIKQWPRAA